MAFSVIITSCKDDDDLPQIDPLEIFAIKPDVARQGEMIYMFGIGFSETASENIVTFSGGASATINSTTENQLMITVPDGAQDGPITVQVGDDTAESPNFTVDRSPAPLPDPVISNINPANGFAGNEITITGENFSSDLTELIVLFNTTGAEIVSASTTQIVVTVPNGLTEGPALIRVIRHRSISETAAFTVDPVPVAVRVTYWSSEQDNTISRGIISTGGVQIETLYDASSNIPVNAPKGVAIDTENNLIYWSNTTDIQILRAPLDGSGPVEVAFEFDFGTFTGAGIAADIALDATNNALFFTANVAGQEFIQRGDLTSGEVTDIYNLSLVFLLKALNY